MQRGNQSRPKTLLHLIPADKDFSRLLRFAQENRADVLVIGGRQGEVDTEKYFFGFKKIKEFSYKKKFVRVLVRD
jgi:hypothetical protein